MSVDSNLALKIQTLPNEPGVYQFYDKDGKHLYVGKAKSLKKRVKSYFNKVHTYQKLNVLVKKISNIEHIIVQNETEALLLENSLIKNYQPRYNVLLKDDKTYPWICIKKERFPRVMMTRKLLKDGSDYFGPYTSYKTIKVLMNLIRSIYPIRSCTLNLSPEKIDSKKYKVCLEYHIGNCEGPCVNLQSETAYMANINAVKKILNGNFKESLRKFYSEMQQYSDKLAFEEAQKTKEKINILESYQSKSTIVSPSINNIEVYSIVSDTGYAYINTLQIAHGSIIRSSNLEIKKKLDESDQELLKLAIIELRGRYQSNTTHLLLPFQISFGNDLKIETPKIGDKKKLLDLSIKNAKMVMLEKFKQIQITDPERHQKRIITQIQNDLKLKAPPVHMECFDNSNIQGEHPVAACVVFKNAKPSKNDYRHFNIKTVEGPNDFASMEEIVYRRYKRIIFEDKPLPQLIVVDGGKGQLSSAVKSLKLLGIEDKVAIIGIAKRMEEIFIPKDPHPLYLNKKSETLKVIQQMRNEAHRFGITFHRNKRNKASLTSELNQIDKIGILSTQKLLIHFKSIKGIKTASLETLIEVMGYEKGKSVYDFYQRKTDATKKA